MPAKALSETSVSNRIGNFDQNVSKFRVIYSSRTPFLGLLLIFFHKFANGPVIFEYEQTKPLYNSTKPKKHLHFMVYPLFRPRFGHVTTVFILSLSINTPSVNTLNF